jgi:hypothetical protein
MRRDGLRDDQRDAAGVETIATPPWLLLVHGGVAQSER